jgi:hypothetical protein
MKRHLCQFTTTYLRLPRCYLDWQARPSRQHKVILHVCLPLARIPPLLEHKVKLTHERCYDHAHLNFGQPTPDAISRSDTEGHECSCIEPEITASSLRIYNPTIGPEFVRAGVEISWIALNCRLIAPVSYESFGWAALRTH